MIRLPRLCASLAAAALTGFVSAAHAVPVYNNIALATDQTDPVFGNGPLAQSFNAGNGGVLNSVQLLLTSASAIDPTGVLTVSLLASNGNAPGATIATLGTILNSAVPTGSYRSFTVSSTARTLLTYGTTYWLALNETAANGVAWAMSNTTTATGVAGQFSSDQSLGVTPVATGGAFQASIDVPEPASLALLATGVLGLATRRRRA